MFYGWANLLQLHHGTRMFGSFKERTRAGAGSATSSVLPRSWSTTVSPPLRTLDHPKSSISRHVDRLKAGLGIRLLERSTRRVRLTEVGSEYYACCPAALDDLESADRDVAVHRSNPVGIVRVSCPTGIARKVMPRILPAFFAHYPEVRIQLQVTNRAVDPIQEAIDVAIRARVRMQDESPTMRRLGASRLIFVASPGFIAAHAIPSDLAGIAKLPFLSFREQPERQTWTVQGSEGASRTVTFDPILWTSEFDVLIEAACAGTGVAEGHPSRWERLTPSAIRSVSCRVSGLLIKGRDDGLIAAVAGESLTLAHSNLHLSKEVDMSPNEQTIRTLYSIAEGTTKNSADFVSMFAEGGYFRNMSSGQTFYGRDISQTVDITAAAFPDIHRDLLNVYLDGDVVIVELTINGTHDGDLKTPARVISPTHKAMKTPCRDVFHLKDGKVLSFHCYVIETVIMRQLGLT